MPDGLTHALAAYLAVGRYAKGAKLALFLVGTLLPDILLRGGRLFLTAAPNRDQAELFLVPFHSPIPVAILYLGLAQLFRHGLRQTVFLWLYLGCLLHFLLDMMQRTINGAGFTFEAIDGYQWLYPISWFDFQVGLLWPEDFPWVLVIIIPLAIWQWRKGWMNHA